MLWICHSFDAIQHDLSNSLVRKVAGEYSYQVLFSKSVVILQNAPSSLIESNSSAEFILLLIESEESSLEEACKKFTVDKSQMMILRDSARKAYQSELHRNIYESEVDSLLRFSYEGVPVGQYALIDLSLCRKTSAPTSYISFFRHTVFLSCIYIACLKALTIKPEVAIVENEYSYCKSSEHFLKIKFDCDVNKVTFATTSPSLITFYKDRFYDSFLRRALASSPLTLSSEHLAYAYATQYIRNKIVLASTSQSYSPSIHDWDSESCLANYLSRKRRSIAYFSSSGDEIASAEIAFKSSGVHYHQKQKLFDNELDCVEKLSKFCHDNGHGLVIRLHPRLCRTSRESYVSSSYESWTDLISDLSSKYDIFTVLPQDQINSYHLGLRVKAGVYWWSSMGVELGMLGAIMLPAVYDNSTENIRYDFVDFEWPVDASNWFKCLESVISTRKASIFDPLQAAKAFYYLVGFGSSDARSTDSNSIRQSVEMGSLLSSLSNYKEIRPNMLMISRSKINHLLYIQDVLSRIFKLPIDSHAYKVIETCLQAVSLFAVAD